MPLALAIGWVLLAGVGELDCRERSTCPAETPVRSGGQCVAATDAGPTDAGTDAATVDAGPCGACSIDLPVCDEARLRCVCDDTNGCLGPTASHCIDGGCYECETDEDCGSPMRAHCNTTTHECEGCTQDAHCGRAGGTSTPECDETSRTCLACTVANEGTLCGADPGGTSCNIATGACTDTPRRSVRRCGACLADSECMTTDELCVPMIFMGAAREGGYCLLAVDCARPYSVLTPERRSLSGAPLGQYCGIDEMATTCEAVSDLLDGDECTVDDNCGAPGLDDGRCERVGALDGQCTYSCGSAVQCPMGLSCGAGYCGS